KDSAEQSKRQVRFALKRIDLREAEVCAEEVRLELEGLAEQAGAFLELLLLESNGPENRIGGGTGFWIREGQPRLPLCLVQMPLLHQPCSVLESVALVDSTLGGGDPRREQKAVQQRCAHGPSARRVLVMPDPNQRIWHVRPGTA